MNPQLVSDFISRHLLTQNRKAAIGDRCVYRTKDGCSCAAGCLFRDYDPKLEGSTDVANVYFFKAFQHILTHDDAKIIFMFQQIHDNSDVHEWEYHLRELAVSLGLLPFSRCDLQSRRGIEHPLPLWTEEEKQRVLGEIQKYQSSMSQDDKQ